MRISGDGRFREENKVTRMKHDHRKSKLGFPFDLIPCEERKKKKRESLILLFHGKKTYLYITYWTYIYTHSWDPQYSKIIKEKTVQYLTHSLLQYFLNMNLTGL